MKNNINKILFKKVLNNQYILKLSKEILKDNILYKSFKKFLWISILKVFMNYFKIKNNKKKIYKSI